MRDLRLEGSFRRTWLRHDRDYRVLRRDRLRMARMRSVLPAPLLQAAIDQSPALVTIVDQSGCILFANSRWNQFNQMHHPMPAAYSDDDAYLAYYGIAHPADVTAAAARARLAEVIAGKRQCFLLLHHASRQGRTRWLQMRATKLGGHPNRALIVHFDVSDVMRAESEYRKLSASLLVAQEAERKRIAREIHDSTAQDLVAAKLYLERALAQIGPEHEASVGLQKAEELLGNSLRELRTLSYALHPPMLEEVGLISAIRWYVAGFADRTGIQVRAEAPESLPRLPEEIERAVFRIVQEALTNVYRHSGSKVAVIGLTMARNRILLEIVDRGTGIPKSMLEHNLKAIPGLGISGMRARAHQYNGTLVIESGDHGTTIRATFPCVPPAGVPAMVPGSNGTKVR